MQKSLTRAIATFSILYLLLAVNLLAAPADKAPLPDLSKASWIWSSPKGFERGEIECYFRKTFTLKAKPRSAAILITVDNDYDLFINGDFVGGDGGSGAEFWKSVEKYDLTKLLIAGENVIALRGRTLGGSAGLIAAIRVDQADGKALNLRSDATWRVVNVSDTGWWGTHYDDTPWPFATAFAANGKGVWGRVAYGDQKSPGVRGRPSFTDPGPDYVWPTGIVYISDYVALKEPQNFTVHVRGSRSYFEHDTASPAALGRKLHTLIPASPEGKSTLLFDAGKGLIGPPSVSFDGKTIYFSHAPEGDHFFRVYSIGADGKNLKALTTGLYHDFDPEPLPGGRIAFSSTRIGSRDEYHGNFASSLFTMDADGKNITPLTYHIVADHEPKVTALGSIAFIRCDNFFERAKVETRLNQVRQDGAGGIVVLGAERQAVGNDSLTGAEHNSSWLRQNGFGTPAPLPNDGIAALTHQGLIASGMGGSGASKLEQFIQSKEVSFSLFDIAATPDGRLLCTVLGRRWIGIIDPALGGMTRVHTGDNIHSPAFLGLRPTPPVQPNLVDQRQVNRPDKTGILLCQNVFETKQTNAPVDRIKAIRVYEGRPFTLRAVHHRFVHIGVETVELGTVPVAADGSFVARVPADRALALQAVDAEGRPVINELSWIYVRPGETRSCVGCHSPRDASPLRSVAMATRAKPPALLGQGDPYRYRGNNGANGGVLNLQMDRFREVSAINLYERPQLDGAKPGNTVESGRQGEVARLCKLLDESKDDGLRISSARRLGILRDRAAEGSLLNALLVDPIVEVRLAAALALAPCGTRSSFASLLQALGDKSAPVAQATNIALENITGHTVGFDAYNSKKRVGGIESWKVWIDENDEVAIEKALIARLAEGDTNAIAPLSNSTELMPGGKALRAFIEKNLDKGELRSLMEAMRALGQMKDNDAVPLLTRVLKENYKKSPGKPKQLHELGWSQRPSTLAAAAAEALGRIGTPKAEEAILKTFPKLLDFWQYSYWAGHHTWLMGCQASIVHFRMLEALDAMETRVPARLVPYILRSIPIDPDRALLYENDTYETLAGRVVRRSGQAPAVLETCLAILGDPSAKVASSKLKDGVTASAPAVSVLPHDPETRAAQIASVVALSAAQAPRLRAAFQRYRAKKVSRTRTWTCFFLARTLGEIGDTGSVDALLSALNDDPTEASFGFETPPNVFVYKAMAPFYRAAVAAALGDIGDPRATETLIRVAGDFDNAPSVRQAAARSLGKIAGKDSLPKIRELAADYPEITTGRALREACLAIEAR